MQPNFLLPLEYDSKSREVPPDDARLWRYMDVGRFFSFIDEEILYFARAWELRERGDRWEAARVRAVNAFCREFPLSPESVGLRQVFDATKETAVVSCWHENELESVAMWKLYTSGPEGVAIQTTMADLRRVLAHARVSDQSRLYIVRVKYADHERSCGQGALQFLEELAFKRLEYVHEQEVRVVVLNPGDWVGHRHAIPPVENTLEKGEGLKIRICPKDLVKTVVASPEYPPFAIKALRDMVTGAGLQFKESDLRRLPEDAAGQAG